MKDISEFSKCQLTLAFLKEYIVTSQEKYSIALKRFLLFIVDGPHFSEFHEGFWKIFKKLASPPLREILGPRSFILTLVRYG